MISLDSSFDVGTGTCLGNSKLSASRTSIFNSKPFDELSIVESFTVVLTS
jgi:hypothetical protein